MKKSKLVKRLKDMEKQAIMFDNRISKLEPENIWDKVGMAFLEGSSKRQDITDFNPDSKSWLQDFIESNPMPLHQEVMMGNIRAFKPSVNNIDVVYEKMTDFEKAINEAAEQLYKSDSVCSKMETTELVKGKWYKNSYGCLVCYAGKLGYQGDLYGYGFTSNGRYIPKEEEFNVLTDKHGLRLATKEEVENALIKEAKRLGFEKGATIEYDGHQGKIIGNLYWATGSDCLSVETDSKTRGNENFPVMLNGVWSKVIKRVESPKEESKDIDWNKAGLIVWDKIGGDIVIVGENIDDDSFSGTVIREGLFKVGYASGYWIKELFEIYNGSITLKNETKEDLYIPNIKPEC